MCVSREDLVLSIQITLVTDQLFPAVSLREKITSFIDHHLFQNQAGEDDPSSNEFVFIRRLPVFNEKIIHEHHDLMHIGLVNTLNQCKNVQLVFDRMLLLLLQ